MSNPDWLSPDALDDPPHDVEAEAVLALCVRGLILLKRFFYTPQGTKNETDAANDLVKLIKELKEKTDVRS